MRYLMKGFLLQNRERFTYLTGDLKGEALIDPETTRPLLPRGACATRGILEYCASTIVGGMIVVKVVQVVRSGRVRGFSRSKQTEARTSKNRCSVISQQLFMSLDTNSLPSMISHQILLVLLNL
jgi:hypothetical protein